MALLIRFAPQSAKNRNTRHAFKKAQTAAFRIFTMLLSKQNCCIAES